MGTRGRLVMNLNDLFVYEDNTGRLLWKGRRIGRGCVPGKEAGTKAHHGYRAVMVNGKKYYVHRIVWEMRNGVIPEGLCIDHIDGDCSNNRLDNLRLVTLSGNQRNSKLPRNNSTGIHGIYPKGDGFEVR